MHTSGSDEFSHVTVTFMWGAKGTQTLSENNHIYDPNPPNSVGQFYQNVLGKNYKPKGTPYGVTYF